MDTKRPGTARVAAASAVCVLALAACASPHPIAVPANLSPAANEALTMIVAATGVQVYECRPGKDAGAYEWAFVAPDAELFDNAGRLVGRHGVGPSWQANDGSRVVGTVKARADAPAAGSIPWLLLDAKSAGPDGMLAKVTSVQRVNTHGGIAPAAGCSKDTTGRSTRVAYTADYYFFTAR